MFARLLAVRFLVLILVLLAPLSARADLEYAYTILDLPPASGDARGILQLRAIANNGTLAGMDVATTVGGFASRISSNLEVTPITCPPEVFERYPFAANLGPEVLGMNNALTVVGGDQGISNQYGFEQTVDGTCTFTLVSGSVGTLFTGVNDAGDVVGTYWTSADEPPFGLRRVHGFRRESGTIIPLAGLGPNDIVWPTAINAVGDIVGYLYRDVGTDNSYTYQAFYLRGGVMQGLDGPDGGDLWLTALNNAGQAVAISGSAGVVGGEVWLYDAVTQTFTPLPEPTPEPTPEALIMYPRGLNDHGAIVGLYLALFPATVLPGPGRTEVHNFLGQPVVESPPKPPKHHPRRPQWWKHRRHALPHLREVLEERREARAQHGAGWGALWERRWQPCLDDDGTVVLTDGVQVVGRSGH